MGRGPYSSPQKRLFRYRRKINREKPSGSAYGKDRCAERELRPGLAGIMVIIFYVITSPLGVAISATYDAIASSLLSSQ